MMSIKQIVTKIINEEVDKILGGKADGMTLEDIAEKHKVSLESIKSQLKKGIKIEREHTKKDSLAREIAKDHLVEFPDYYDRLEIMEKKAEKDLEKNKK